MNGFKGIKAKAMSAAKYVSEKAVSATKGAKKGLMILGIGALSILSIGGTAMAEEGTVTIPTSPIDTTGLADGAFSTFGDTVTTVFPYVIALCAVFFAINFIKRLAGGRR